MFTPHSSGLAHDHAFDPPPLRSFGALAGLLFAMTLWGCGANSDLGPEDYVQAVSPPSVAGSPVISMPTGIEIRYDPQAVGPRRFAYDHQGNSPYSDAATELLDTSGNERASNPDRYFKDGWYYQTSVINNDRLTAPYDGPFVIKATYRTHNPSAFQEAGGFRERSATRAFRICPAFNPGCNQGGRAAPSDPSGGGFAQDRAAVGADAGKMQSCAPDSEGNPTCGGGGGGGGATMPAYLQLRTHTASMGPFFASSTVGSSASRSEIEDILESLNPDQLDGIADIVQEAYGESVYGALHVPEGAVATAFRRAATAAPDDSPFLALMAPLTEADRSAMGVERLYFDRLLQVGERYRTTRAAEASHRASATAASGPTAGLGEAGKTGGETTSLSAAMWPNPTSSRLNIRVRAGHGAAVGVYDAVGRLVTRIPVTAGSSDEVVVWDLRTARGQRVAAGVYQIVLSGDGARHATTVTVL